MKGLAEVSSDEKKAGATAKISCDPPFMLELGYFCLCAKGLSHKIVFLKVFQLGLISERVSSAIKTLMLSKFWVAYCQIRHLCPYAETQFWA